ncbi:MAG: hypothetical protein HQK99_04245 [Nitrospirae bacterium]|nr:hypothetical protein [Nitrospirota bacterium]
MMPVESIGSIVGPRAVGASSGWAKREGGRKKMRKEKRKVETEKSLIDIVV